MKIFLLLFPLVVFSCFGGFIYYYFIHESPEECFVKQMKIWADKEDLLGNIPGLIQKDEKMAVSRAKAISETYGIEGMETPENKKIYLQVKTTFDYCKIN